MSPVRALLSAAALLSACTAFAASPTIDANGVVTIPRIDSKAQIGLYQDVTLQLGAQGQLSIVQLQQLGASRVYNVGEVGAVEVKKTGTLPVSVYLQVSGVANACDFTGPARAHQSLQGSQFDVNISAPHANPVGTVIACTADIRPFKLTVPLQVYGLAAGNYSYRVNGLTGTFRLDADNRYADDCDVTKAGRC